MLKMHMEFVLICHQEAPDGTSTNHWEIEGQGDGQAAYAKEKLKWPKADIRIRIREVVTTEWIAQTPNAACTGTGYAHKAHGECPGFATDRT